MDLVASERLVRQVVHEVMARRLTSGLAVAAGMLDSRGRVWARRHWTVGVLGADDLTPVSPETVYDLASLTKVLSTTLLCAVAVAAGKLRLDETPWPWWPGVTVAHVLSHTAGLPAWVPLWRGVDVVSCDARQRALASLRAVALQVPPGTRCVYSDVGFIALGLLLPQRLGGTLPTVFRRHADRWYGPNGLRFAGVGRAAWAPFGGSVAPTGWSALRGRIVCGEVNDDNAFVLGGAAGHAGLFGGLSDVEQAVATLLRTLTNRGARPDEEGVGRTLRRFAQARMHGHPLGFDVAGGEGSTAGWLGRASVGHLGFTGTSLWLDPVGRGTGGLPVYTVLLSNAVHQGYRADRIRWLRRRVHWALSLWAREVSLVRNPCPPNRWQRRSSLAPIR